MPERFEFIGPKTGQKFVIVLTLSNVSTFLQSIAKNANGYELTITNTNKKPEDLDDKDLFTKEVILMILNVTTNQWEHNQILNSLNEDKVEEYLMSRTELQKKIFWELKTSNNPSENLYAFYLW